jgi:outer membrane protein OmpA-like peptidoglycan-associated protein
MVTPKPVPAPSVQGGVVSIPFAAEQADLPKENLAALDSLAQQMSSNEDRLQIRAYAASTGTDGSGARRLSLSRALAVRAYLIDKGIRSTRIDVRALGTPTDGSPADRVEVAPAGR